LKQGHDVVIVGAGPAGAVLAYELAKRGIGVLLLEKEKLPRYKCCAGGVTTKAAKLVDFDFFDVVEDVVHKVSFTFDLQDSHLRQHDRPLVYTVMRDGFDHLLANKAREAGATLMDGREVTGIHLTGDWVEICTDGTTVRARLVVGADGAYSAVVRELGIDRKVQCATGMESEVLLPDEKLDGWRSTARMELGFVRNGYAWVFPKRRHLSVGAGCLSADAKRLKKRYDEFLGSIGDTNCVVVRSGSHLIPTYAKGKLIWRDKALLVGDAAGLTDPLTGEGIHNAILSAQLAAPVIENLLVHENAGLDNYQQAIEERIISELRMAGVLSRLFVRFPKIAYAMLNRSDGVWRACCGLISGELKYADIMQKAGGRRGILEHLFRGTTRKLAA